ncbi:MAG: RnfH family protein [Burkholderiales bacterium]|nr:RnfH family protein [Burkholderiales bacterium]
MGESIEVMVAWAAPDGEELRRVRVPDGASIADALRAAALPARIAGHDPMRLRVGIWGRLRKHETALRDGDRIELYRPLVADPNTARQERVAKKRAAARR